MREKQSNRAKSPEFTTVLLGTGKLPVADTLSVALARPLNVCLNSPAMSRICEICGRGRLRGKLVPRLIGRRVSHRSTAYQQVNLREKRLNLGGRMVKVKLCTSCLSLYNKSRDAQAK